MGKTRSGSSGLNKKRQLFAASASKYSLVARVGFEGDERRGRELISMLLTATKVDSSIPRREMKGGSRVMKADTETEVAVMNVVKQCFEAFNKRDLDACLKDFPLN